MTVEHKKKKEYDPPIVKEIGGTFEQAMGVTSNCATGVSFGSGDSCTNGSAPAGGGCSTGSRDQGCSGGGSDAACATGWGG